MTKVSMDNLLEDFHKLKISAIKKALAVNSSIHNVTLGPNSIIETNEEPKDKTKKQQVRSENKTNISTKQNLKVSPLKKLLSEYEIQRQEKLQEAITVRKSQIVNFQKWQERENREQWFRQQQSMIEQREQQELQILKDLEQHDKDVLIQHEKLIQYYQELAENRKKKDDEIQAKEQRKKLLNDIINKIQKDQLEFRCTYEEILNILKANIIHDEIKNSITAVSQDLKVLPDSMEEIVIKCKSGKISYDEAQRSAELLGQLVSIKQKIVIIIDDYNKQLDRIKEQEKQKQIKQAEELLAKQLPKPVPEDAAPSNKNLNVMDKYVSKTSFRYYSELLIFLQNHEERYKQLADDDSMKQFKFDCKKAVNIPVNAISAVSPQHLLDKYNRLYNLLTGKVVLVGDVQMSASKHPQGIAFCMDLLAKKFVLQGDLMISSNPEAAFCYAAVILALWNDFPDFGKLLLAHFYKECPYLVPLYIPKTIGQSDEEYYKNLGYQYNDGVVEKQDKFLKRMTGITRLYSAILIGKLRKTSAPHPHDLTNGWRWITSVLNLEPRTDITASIIHTFLETAGYMMQNCYGKEFKKIINFIIHAYMPAMKKIDSGGPVTRLEVLLQEYLQRGHFERPTGLLPNNFW